MATRIDRAVKYSAPRQCAVYADDVWFPDVKWRLGPFDDHEAATAAKLLVWGDQKDDKTRGRLGIGACLIEMYEGSYKQRNLVHDWTGFEDAERIRRVYGKDRHAGETP